VASTVESSLHAAALCSAEPADKECRVRRDGLVLPQITAASAIAAAVCFKLTHFCRPPSVGKHPARPGVLVIVSSVGFTLIAVLARLFRVRELDSYLAKLRL